MPSVLYDLKDHVAYITLNRPEAMNSVNRDLGEELGAAWRRFRDDPEARVAVLSAAGEKAFCAGIDLRWMAEDPAAKDPAKVEEVIVQLSPFTHDVWKPVIAAVGGGYCMGIAWWIVECCDLRIAAEDAQFAISEVRLNIMPRFTGTLWTHLPPAQALELLLVGDRISAHRAFEMGFVNRVVPRADLLPAAAALAARVVENAPVAVRRTKELFYRSEHLSEEQSVALADYMARGLRGMEDTKEALRAFGEKRKPIWKGQ